MENSLRIETTEDAIAAARDFGTTTGPIAALAGGEAPACFARLGIELSGLLIESRATEAALHEPDGPDDALFERGKDEMAAIIRAVSDLNAWVDDQRCAVEMCECRADRLLRRLLRERRIPEQLGYSPQLQRMTAVIAGWSDEGAYVLVDYRTNIQHAVSDHHGWRARLVTSAGVAPLYESPDYPNTARDLYYDDTRACVDAVAEALGR
jgi:hypothetical protein